ncbi:uncharacterized protein KD926_001802 [Aspergillus affinis]|uniref:uncharacterized protein n=1 Tax=Aspergillus affinis TaxID=1070780 RepID=UPI0022FE1048|nr:uncharacterized protein KD926_001802 [Aspergillus affinis]KAI9036459.1 hypothetical protein KD926_001802 [Aspergillus affinis]
MESGTGVPYGDLWIHELRQGTVDAFVAFLLTQVPNLRYLYLDNFTRQSALLGMLLRSAICEHVNYQLPDFQHLRDVYFLLADRADREPDETVMNAADILPFFYLPSLQKISASIENPVSFTWPAAHPPVPSNFKSLDLTCDQGVYLEVLDLDRFTAAISHVRDTLMELTVSAHASRCGVAFSYPAVNIVGSLHQMVKFEMLRRLEIPWPLLVGFVPDTTKRLHDVIPSNIESLVLTDDLRLHNIRLYGSGLIRLF